MITAKVALTVPKEVLDRARLAVKRGKAASPSAYVTRALEHMVKEDDFDALLDEKLQRSGGPVTEQEARRIDAILDGIEQRRRARAERRK
jgi:Arc/MetJ-type ribon-helix-helix transcriptional regulator